jgi:hypothetical protein
MWTGSVTRCSMSSCWMRLNAVWKRRIIRSVANPPFTNNTSAPARRPNDNCYKSVRMLPDE